MNALALQNQYQLTDNEVQALNFLGEGKNADELAECLGVSDHTADQLVKSLLRKTRLPNVRFLKNMATNATRSTLMLPQYVKCELPAGCGDSKPIGWFPQWPMKNICIDCLARYEDKTKEHARWEKAKKVVTSLIAETNVVKVSVPKIQELLATAYDDFGGAVNFVKTLTQQIKLACELRPGSKSTIDAMMALVKLNLEVNKFDASEDEKRMSDKELKEVMWGLVQQRMNEGMLDQVKKAAYDEFMQSDAGIDTIEHQEPASAE